MENTPENFAMVMEKLMTLKWMKGFPVEERSIEDRVQRLMKIVRNKEALQCILDGCGDNEEVRKTYEWDHDFDGYEQKFHGRDTKMLGDPKRNDLDWIIDRIGEECHEFPSQRRVREMYCERLTPEDRMRMRAEWE